MKSLTIRSKILLAFSLVSLASTIAFTVYAYYLQRETILSGIDQKLTVAALSVATILPDGFHDQISDSNSVSTAEHLENMHRLTDFARQTDVSFVYSFVKKDGKVYFTSTSGTEEQFQKRTTMPFFEHYKEVTPGVLRMFETGETITETSQDEYGAFRSILFPLKNKNNQTYVVGADIYTNRVNQRLHQTFLLCISIGLLSFLAVFLISILLSNRITRPIIQLAQQADQLGANNFVADEKCAIDLSKMAERRNDEVGHLALAFARMLKKLAEYIEDLRTTTAAKQKIESELNIARNIQMSFIPKTFPAFPERKEFDLYATLEPAREVGGDLYNFCMADDRHLYFGVGDVSDKGVPAALFMAVTQTMMKAVAQIKDITSSEILTAVNKELCQQNDALMFVTMFCAIYEIQTGELTFSNAGHNPPVIVRANGSTEWLKLPPGLVLGVDAVTTYQMARVNLAPGDMIIAYTDGVTEAMSPDRELYSEARLARVAAECSGKSPKETVEYMTKSVKDHAGTAPQSDDITIMAVKILDRKG
ncbi:MAG: PP2C family protein-serine/threonine phosphatase [Kiritimatiellae bacterium]|nr:PP2C family protein-serine/threonine phosphatase [Kiritimatiellia bacterium]MDD5519743.1 PP2C family protein-serine/threonine phosphatase [Kiritimatiellia bacterium]